MRLTGLTPMLEVDDVQLTIDFYSTVLGFECAGRFPDDESPAWALLKHDDVEIMFTSRNAHSTIEEPVMTGSLYIDSDNVDEMWSLVKDKATIEYPIENFDYGMREFAIRDCNGYLIQFGAEIQQ